MKTAEYDIVVDNLPELEFRIAGLNKKAAKLGMAPIVLTKGPTYVKKVERRESDFGLGDHDGSTGRYEIVRMKITLTGETPKINGWEFVALLQHEDGGTIIKATPGVPEGTLKSYRNATPACAHCQTTRRRNDTFVVQHETGELKQVGRNCLRDFLGHANPHGLASYAELLMVAGDLCTTGGECDAFGLGMGQSKAVSLQSFTRTVVAAVRQFGWLSRTKAREMGREGAATADLALAEMFRKPATKAVVPNITGADGEDAATLLKYVTEKFEAADPEKLSDYEHNLRVAVLSGYVTAKSAGIAGSLVVYAQRAIAEDVERKLVATGVRKHVGTIGERPTLVLTVLTINAVDTEFGTVRYFNFRDADGNRLVWKSSGNSGVTTRALMTWQISDGKEGDSVVPNAKQGETYEVTGTIDKHSFDRRGTGVPETWLKRCVVTEVGVGAMMPELKKVTARRKRDEKKKAKESGDAGETPGPLFMKETAA